MGSTSSMGRLLLIVAILGQVLLSMPSVQAEERTYSYTIPNSTPISLGYVNDTLNLPGGSEVNMSWVSDVTLFSFTIKCGDHATEHHFGHLRAWSKEYSIDVDCTVFFEWINDKDVPAHVELTIVTESPPFWSNELILLISLATVVVLVVAIAVSMIRRRSVVRVGGQDAIEVTPISGPSVEPPRGPAVADGTMGTCAYCGAWLPTDAEFCEGCNRPTDAFRRGRE